MKPAQDDREQQASEHGAQAVALRMNGRPAEAMDHANQGVTLVEELLAERPKDPGTLHVLAGQLYNRAAIHEQLGQPGQGVPDARRSVGLYQQLIPLDAFIEAAEGHAGPRAADAEARLARLLALASGDAVPGGAEEARAAIARAVATYTGLAQADPRYLPELARLKFSRGEVPRMLAQAAGAQPPADALWSYTEAVNLYGDIGERRSEADEGYYAHALMAVARLHELPEARLVYMDVILQDAVDQLSRLMDAGQNWDEEYVEALYLFALLKRDVGFPDWADPLREALRFLSFMPRPLGDETAQRERDIQHLLGDSGIQPAEAPGTRAGRAARTAPTRSPRITRPMAPAARGRASWCTDSVSRPGWSGPRVNSTRARPPDSYPHRSHRGGVGGGVQPGRDPARHRQPRPDRTAVGMIPRAGLVAF